MLQESYIEIDGQEKDLFIDYGFGIDVFMKLLLLLIKMFSFFSFIAVGIIIFYYTWEG